MTTKRPLSPAYARRIANALARGKTRQQARGHKPGEARVRATREREEHGLSSYDERSIRNWVNRRSRQIHDSDFDADEVIEYFREGGYETYIQYRDTWDHARRRYKAEQKDGSYASRGLGYLTQLTATAGVEDISWLYYH